MREQIRLTPEERLQLEQIEQRLRAEDPALVRRLGWGYSRRSRALFAVRSLARSATSFGVVAAWLLVGGAFLTIAAMPMVPLAAAGYLGMVAGCIVLASRSPSILASAAARLAARSRSTARRLSS